jgi:hypothetical protein
MISFPIILQKHRTNDNTNDNNDHRSLLAAGSSEGKSISWKLEYLESRLRKSPLRRERRQEREAHLAADKQTSKRQMRVGSALDDDSFTKKMGLDIEPPRSKPPKTAKGQKKPSTTQTGGKDRIAIKEFYRQLEQANQARRVATQQKKFQRPRIHIQIADNESIRELSDAFLIGYGIIEHPDW